jgi:hypothetical protein
LIFFKLCTCIKKKQILLKSGQRTSLCKEETIKYSRKSLLYTRDMGIQ